MFCSFIPSENFSKRLLLTAAVAGVVLVSSFGATPAQASYLQRYLISSDAVKNKDIHFNAAVFADVQKFYAERGYAPVWVSNESGMSANAKTAISELEQSWQHGLRPDKYLSKDVLGAEYSKRRSVLARSEFLLSYGLALYAHDMTSMRVDPRAIKQKAEYWRAPITGESALRVLSAAKNDGELRSAIEKMSPQNGLYRRLKNEYVRLVSTGELSKAQVVVRMEGLIRPGQSHKSIAQFRERMGLEKLAGMDNYVYDDVLADKIKAFQQDNGLKTDGVLGPQTVKYLNRTAEGRAEQLLANMERMRWLEPNKPKRYVEVNIPSMSLWGFENGKAVLSMPVVVGRVGRPTQSFKAEITGVRINPKWTVPHRIRTQDFWPDLKQDANVLAEKNIDVIEGYGRDAIYHDPTAIDWNNISYREFNKYRLVQKPGDHNALGRIRVLMPNNYTIYLHDTNHPEVFEKDYRAASSGCIRLKYPEKMAEFLLRGHEASWGSDKMGAIYSSLKTTDLQIEDTMPVYILYQTNWLNNKGDIVFGPDLYKRDKKLIALLKQQGDFYMPQVKDRMEDGIKLASRE
tara:strand:- start:152562 stop:154280 length:1719 start_codon:yes stop_codon:yes gene_type:complete